MTPVITVEIAECRRETVAAMLARCATERPQCVLKSAGQGHETLAAKHYLGMLPAAERQPKVIEPMQAALVALGSDLTAAGLMRMTPGIVSLAA